MKILKLIILVIITNHAFSQNTVPTSGAVNFDTSLKIGNQVSTSTDGQINRLSLQPYRHTGGPWIFKSRDNGSVAFLDIDYGISSIMSLNSDKNVGIGVVNPVSKLSIDGSITLNSGLTNVMARPALSSGNLAKSEIRGYSGAGNAYDDGFLRLSAGGGTNLSVKTFIDLSGYSTVPDMNNNIVFGTAGAEKMRIDKSGNLGIGTKNPANKLDVNGTIHSKEVKVDMTGWSDFVFKKEYNLPTLKQVEKHITEKGHLENIPNEEEVLKNGINLGEMDSKLLQKIEELTLYVIEQNKRLDKVEKENAELKNEIKTSKKR
ncbi:hypothetical protein ACWA1F_13310 [Flavobacterium sp. 3-218]